MNEKLLSAWLRISTLINNDRLVSELPYNESLVCNLLYENQQKNPEHPMTATDLCSRTRMLKSQMNRTLNSLEQKHMISRERSRMDKRQVYVLFTPENNEAYEAQHKKIIALIDSLIEKFGAVKTEEIIAMFTMISDTIEEVVEW